MKVTLESLRFTLISYVLVTCLGAMTYLTYTMIGINTARHEWIAIIGVIILMVILYRIKGWGKVYNKTIVWSSVTLIVLFTLLIPDVSPTHLHTTQFAYSYGFPFNFLTIYAESGSKFLIPNLIGRGFTDWQLSINVLANFILFYFSLKFLLTFINRTK